MVYASIPIIIGGEGEISESTAIGIFGSHLYYYTCDDYGKDHRYMVAVFRIDTSRIVTPCSPSSFDSPKGSTIAAAAPAELLNPEFEFEHIESLAGAVPTSCGLFLFALKWEVDAIPIPDPPGFHNRSFPHRMRRRCSILKIHLDTFSTQCVFRVKVVGDEEATTFDELGLDLSSNVPRFFFAPSTTLLMINVHEDTTLRSLSVGGDDASHERFGDLDAYHHYQNTRVFRLCLDEVAVLASAEEITLPRLLPKTLIDMLGRVDELPFLISARVGAFTPRSTSPNDKTTITNSTYDPLESFYFYHLNNCRQLYLCDAAKMEWESCTMESDSDLQQDYDARADTHNTLWHCPDGGGCCLYLDWASNYVRAENDAMQEGNRLRTTIYRVSVDVNRCTYRFNKLFHLQKPNDFLANSCGTLFLHATRELFEMIISPPYSLAQLSSWCLADTFGVAMELTIEHEKQFKELVAEELGSSKGSCCEQAAFLDRTSLVRQLYSNDRIKQLLHAAAAKK